MRRYPAPNIWSAICAVVLVLSFNSKNSLAAAYRSRVEECLDTLIAHGTDRYGPVHTPMLVSILDVKTLTCPRNPKVLDEAWRVTRRERRNPAGSNLLMDLPLLETMVLFSETHGEAKYAEFARGYITYVATNLVDEKGFFWWGWHRHYDVYEDKIAGHAGNHHEIHSIHSVNWDILWKASPRAVKREIEAIWTWHVIDKKTGEVNRHGDGVKGCDFSMSAGAFIEAFAFLFQKTGDRNWLDRALLLTDYYWKQRNQTTNLFAERPNAGPTRFDGGSFTTNIPGLFCHSLLTAFERTRQTHFRDVAVAILKAYAKHGYDPEAQRFWGALRLDGSPYPGPRSTEGYEQYEPRGHLDLWEPYVAGYQYPVCTAQAYVHAYHLTKDRSLTVAAKHFADWIEETPPAKGCMAESWYRGYAQQFAPEGTYAGKCGRTISFFIHLYLLTAEKKYLAQARSYADEAVERLYTNGIFRGHPAKPYYEATDGVGYLLFALLQLEALLENPQSALAHKELRIENTDVRIPLDNW